MTGVLQFLVVLTALAAVGLAERVWPRSGDQAGVKRPSLAIATGLLAVSLVIGLVSDGGLGVLLALGSALAAIPLVVLVRAIATRL